MWLYSPHLAQQLSILKKARATLMAMHEHIFSMHEHTSIIIGAECIPCDQYVLTVEHAIRT